MNKWRKGQSLFNFLEWLKGEGVLPHKQGERMADPFHISDEDFDSYLLDYRKEYPDANI